MKLAVLVDNATLTDRYFLAEPGLSIHIEDGGTRVLFDAGYSGILVANAQKMGIDLLRVDDVVISHGHLDHTWGLDALIRLHTEAILEGRERIEPAFIAHPDAFLTRSCNGVGEIGCHLSVEELFRHGNVLLTPASLWLTENLVFLGEIERRFEFERAPPCGYVYTRRHPGRHRHRRHRARLQDRGGARHRNRLLSLGDLLDCRAGARGLQRGPGRRRHRRVPSPRCTTGADRGYSRLFRGGAAGSPPPLPLHRPCGKDCSCTDSERPGDRRRAAPRVRVGQGAGSRSPGIAPCSSSYARTASGAPRRKRRALL
ncbi:ribonuclease Z [Methanoculleus chikugoensis]|uniref:Ribonuclease Z n=1 Tax=Methanoculleus chikugoensis TaxID=118126 RepID=A0A1M4MLR9_9EURY|nr:ribonuclease Z [Methanoculleus chikugoensis]